MVVNIVAFHLFLAPSGIGLPIVIVALELVLAWSYRGAFCGVLRARVAPDAAAAGSASARAAAPSAASARVAPPDAPPDARADARAV